MAYTKEAVWSSTFPFLPTVGVRALSPLQEPTGNATVTLHASVVVCSSISATVANTEITSLQIQKAHFVVVVVVEFFFLLLYSLSNCYFFPSGFSCWCDVVSTGCKKTDCNLSMHQQFMAEGCWGENFSFWGNSTQAAGIIPIRHPHRCSTQKWQAGQKKETS